MADRILRPDRFEADPHSPSAADQWIHWRKTFDNFLEATKSLKVDQLATLANYVSPSVYKHIAECKSYEDAILILQNLYIQPKNVIFARHVLSTAKQEHGQSLNEFLQRLKSLAIDCDFQAVSAEKYREELIRDSFIRGLTSQSIRQRLLEHRSLDLSSAYDIARQLELALQQSLSYNQNEPVSCALPRGPSDCPTVLPFKNNECATTAASYPKQNCYFCGRPRHLRIYCPARDVICKSCGKRGHYQTVSYFQIYSLCMYI